jgi:hypothetical protein
MRFVPVKTAEQQATALLHRGREQLVPADQPEQPLLQSFEGRGMRRRSAAGSRKPIWLRIYEYTL